MDGQEEFVSLKSFLQCAVVCVCVFVCVCVNECLSVFMHRPGQEVCFGPYPFRTEYVHEYKECKLLVLLSCVCRMRVRICRVSV